MSETEKITINMNVVELGKVDVLVEEGFYQNRTDFIRAAIRMQLAQHGREMDGIITRKTFVIGVTGVGFKNLSNKLENGEMLEVKVIGAFVIDPDVSPELALATIKSVTVRGSWTAPQDVKIALAEAGRVL